MEIVQDDDKGVHVEEFVFNIQSDSWFKYENLNQKS